MIEIAFWYEFASTYSYPAAMRIADVAKASGIAVKWNPFMLGPIFRDQGWDGSPFDIYPAKGRYMWRDLARVCAGQGLEFNRPDPFPQNALLAARLALCDEVGAKRAPFSRAVYVAQFARGQQISDPDVMAKVLRALDIDSQAALAAAESPAIKQRLKDMTAEATKLGIFGAPTMITPDGEMFWGNDRLEAAVNWAVSL